MAKEKAFVIRLTYDMWRFLKEQSIIQERSMNQIITDRLEIYKEKKRIKKKKKVDIK